MAEDFEIKLIEIDQRSKSNTHRINELSGQIRAVNELATAVRVMATEQQHQTEAIEGLNKKVESLEQKPAKRWESIVDKLIWAVLAAGLGFLLAQIGIQ